MAPKAIGYARTSTARQTGGIEAQVLALKEAGCTVVFQEQVSTRLKEKERPQLQAALTSLEEGDELVVSKLDRLGRTQVEVVSRLHSLQQQGIHVRTLDGLVNTRGMGKFAPVLIGLLSGLAEVERSLIQERTLESIQHRRATGGNLGGRPKTNQAKERLVLRLREEGCSYRSVRDRRDSLSPPSAGSFLSRRWRHEVRRPVRNAVPPLEALRHIRRQETAYQTAKTKAQQQRRRFRIVDNNNNLLDIFNP